MSISSILRRTNRKAWLASIFAITLAATPIVAPKASAAYLNESCSVSFYQGDTQLGSSRVAYYHDELPLLRDSDQPTAVAATLTSESPTQNYYSLSGWQRDGSGTIFSAAPTFEQICPAYDAGESGAYYDVDLDPVFTERSYSITYTLNGGSVSGQPTTLTYADRVTLPSSATRTGYIFTGWDVTAGGVTTAVAGGGQFPTVAYGTAPHTAYNNQLGTMTGAGTITIAAKWVQTTGISFNLNSGSGTVPSSITPVRGDLVTLPVGTGLSKSGYTFAGWSGTVGGTPIADEVPGTSGTQWTIPVDEATAVPAVLYAVWTTRVTFNGNAHTAGTPPAFIDYRYNPSTGVNLPGAGVTKDGFSFLGWSTAVGNPQITGEYIPSGPTTLYAVWQATISFSANGGTGLPAIANGTNVLFITWIFGSPALVLPKNGSLAKTSFTFVGWSETQNSSTLVSNAYIPTGTRPLYAVWAQPELPTSAVAFPGNGEARVQWTSAATAQRYIVTASPGGRTCEVPKAKTTCAVAGLTNGVSYTFRVMGLNDVDGQLPATNATAAVSPLNTAKNVVATQLGSRVKVTWTDLADADFYEVTMTPANGTCKVVEPEPAAGPEAICTGLKTGTFYSFSVLSNLINGDQVASIPTESTRVVFTTKTANAFFSGSSAVLTSAEKAKLRKFAQAVKGQPNLLVTIRGFERATRATAYVKRITNARAVATRNFLKNVVKLKATYVIQSAGLGKAGTRNDRRASVTGTY